MSASPRHVATGPSLATLTAPSSASYAPGAPTMAPHHLAPALNTQGAGGQVRARAAHTPWLVPLARPPACPRDGRASLGTAYHPPHHRRHRQRRFFSCPRRPRYRRRRPRRTRSCHRRPRRRRPRPRRRLLQPMPRPLPRHCPRSPRHYPRRRRPRPRLRRPRRRRVHHLPSVAGHHRRLLQPSGAGHRHRRLLRLFHRRPHRRRPRPHRRRPCRRRRVSSVSPSSSPAMSPRSPRACGPR